MPGPVGDECQVCGCVIGLVLMGVSVALMVALVGSAVVWLAS